MNKNIIFYFSGTGNSLHTAKVIAQTVGGCAVYSMTAPCPLTHGFERIGFVFPHYALGVPDMVRRFLESLDFSAQANTYVFAVETMGGFPGNCLAQVRDILRKKGAVLHYGKALRMFANNVTNYDMAQDAAEQTKAADCAALAIAAEIAQKKHTVIRRSNPLQHQIYRVILSTYPKRGLGFCADDACTGCGWCVKLCPAENIAMQNGKPAFGAHCEQCMACIQWCPCSAIQFKNKTQKRKRYHHPSIDIREMVNRKTHDDSTLK